MWGRPSLTRSISFTVDARSVEVAASGDTPLLDVLRNHPGLTGTRFGCGLEQCGAWTVLIDRILRARSSTLRRACGARCNRDTDNRRCSSSHAPAVAEGQSAARSIGVIRNDASPYQPAGSRSASVS